MGMKDIRTYLTARATTLDREAHEHELVAASKRDEANVLRWLDTQVFLANDPATPVNGPTPSPLPIEVDHR